MRVLRYARRVRVVLFEDDVVFLELKMVDGGGSWSERLIWFGNAR